MERMAFIQRDGDPGLAAVARPWVYVEPFVLSTGSREILGLLCLPLLFLNITEKHPVSLVASKLRISPCFFWRCVSGFAMMPKWRTKRL